MPAGLRTCRPPQLAISTGADVAPLCCPCLPPSRQALTAINAFNGRPAGPNKKLVVKFADQK